MNPPYTNRLIHEKSPYLLQHAHNPVDWYPWGEEAFAKAKQEDKPLLLSIGYATCHWCHVMERESFEDVETAHLLNEKFVSIKVDREERPDVDQIYMNALHLTGQQGGWPLNMFLTPERLPITGGTYYPPQPLYGRPSFRQVLEAVSNGWQKERQKLLQSASTLYSYLQGGGKAGEEEEEKGNGQRRGSQRRDDREEEDQNQKGKAQQGQKIGAGDELPSLEHFRQTFRQYQGAYDSRRGGFLNNGPNKFPPSLTLLFLLAYWRRSKEGAALQMVEDTLEHIKRGGIYDQLGGGLSRYSTDHNWLVPHFEKMLYDNALFAWVLVETFRITGKKRYREWAFDLFGYIKREMLSPEGAFYSAEDADSEGEEGKFYLWSREELERCLEQARFTAEERRQIYQFWQVSAAGNFEGRSILHEPQSREAFLRQLGELSQQDEGIQNGGVKERSVKDERTKAEMWEELLYRARRALLELRSRRARPLLDDKILTSWNALMISALSMGARAFHAPELLDQARGAADFLWEKNWSQEEGQPGQLRRRYRQGESRFAGTLVDYSALGSALLDLYRADFDPQHIERAIQLAEAILIRFSHRDGAFYSTEAGAQDLIVRTIEAYDGVEPSGNAMAARLFQTLGLYGIERQRYLATAEGIFSRFASSLKLNGTMHPFLLYTHLSHLSSPVEIALIAPSGKMGRDELATEMLHWMGAKLSAESIQAFAEEDQLEKAAKVVPLLSGRRALEGRSSLYLCRNLTCAAPLHSLTELQKLVDELA